MRTAWNKIIAVFDRVLRHWQIKWIVFPLLIAVGPGTISYSKFNQATSDWLTIHGFVLFVFILLPIALPILREWITITAAEHRKSAANNKEKLYDVLFHLLESIDTIVAWKKDHLCAFLTKVKEGHPLTADEMVGDFDPKEQIKIIAYQIRLFFEALVRDEPTRPKFKVVVADTCDHRVSRYLAWDPRDCYPTTSIEKQNEEGGGFTRTINQAQGIHIVEDIAVELAKRPAKRGYTVEDHRLNTEVGSALVFSVDNNLLHNRPVSIGIKTDTPGFFKKDEKKFYLNLLKGFGNRLCIEHCLLLLKEQLASHPASRSGSDKP